MTSIRDIRIDFRQTRINRATVLAKFQDETSLTFVDYGVKKLSCICDGTSMIRIRTADATWHRPTATKNRTQSLNHFPIPTQLDILRRHMGIRGLNKKISYLLKQNAKTLTWRSDCL